MKPTEYFEYCNTCKNAERKCKPAHIAVLCQKSGIGITTSEVLMLRAVGCMSYQYDGKGLTDLERSYHKRTLPPMQSIPAPMPGYARGDLP